MLLIFPPTAKPSEPPAGIARLAGALRGHGLPCTLLDANLEGLLYLLARPGEAADKWSARAGRNIAANIAAMRAGRLYDSAARYGRAVADINRVLENVSGPEAAVSLANYQEEDRGGRSPFDLSFAIFLQQRSNGDLTPYHSNIFFIWVFLPGRHYPHR